MADNPLTRQSSQTSISTVTTATRAAGLRLDSMYTGPLTPLLKNQYGIWLLDTSTGKPPESATGLNPADPNAPAEYFFKMAPKVHEMNDPFATQITPTQSGGKFVESHGSIIKPIRLSGTTGARPNRGSGEFSAIPLVGEALNQVSSNIDILALRDKRGSVPASEATGFDEIIFLRNIFRRYSDYRENNEFSNHIVMVWYNAKEGDSWIVEPKDIKVSRNASSPLTYEYNIMLETLAPYRATRTAPADPLAKVLAARKIFSRIQEYNRALKNTFLIVSTQIRRLEGLGVFAQTQLLDPIINVTRGLGVIRATATGFGSRLRHNALVLSQELDNAIDLLTGTPGVEAQDALVRTLRRTQVTAARILAEPGVRESVNTSASNRQDRYAGSYTTSGGTTTTARVAPDLGGSTTFLGNNPISDRVAQDFVNGGEDIRAIAGRLLGDKGAWHVLVTVNGLSAPYITSDGRTGTLKVGDPILYPSTTNSVDSSTINPVNTDDSESSGKDANTLGPAQQVYGRDIRVESVVVANSGVALTDLKVNQNGDISTIAGIPNVEQAITLKFATEQGELPVHSYYGASSSLGSKATPPSLNSFRLNTIETITSDSRIRAIQSINFVTVSDILVVQANLVLVNATDSLDTSVALRRV